MHSTVHKVQVLLLSTNNHVLPQLSERGFWMPFSGIFSHCKQLQHLPTKEWWLQTRVTQPQQKKNDTHNYTLIIPPFKMKEPSHKKQSLIFLHIDTVITQGIVDIGIYSVVCTKNSKDVSNCWRQLGISILKRKNRSKQLLLYFNTNSSTIAKKNQFPIENPLLNNSSHRLLTNNEKNIGKLKN